ncbi:exodeoxyribonuclease V subunit gamma [Vibrio chagasii]|nr:exodeoxyribonuclease V subunit gamma [Vibrio chagasii]
MVQSPGMSQWLKMELAKEFGSSKYRFSSSSDLHLGYVYPSASWTYRKRSAFNKEAMTWKLMSLLPAKLDHPDFLPLQRYL